MNLVHSKQAAQAVSSWKAIQHATYLPTATAATASIVPTATVQAMPVMLTQPPVA